MKSLLAGALTLVLMLVCGAVAAAQKQQQTIAQENSDAVARKLFSTLIQHQIGAPVPPDRLWAYEVDLNLDGFSEIYGYVDQSNCDGVNCGLFLFVLKGSDYREVLGGIPGARLSDPSNVRLGDFKRNDFLELQLGDTLAGWNGQTYVDTVAFPKTTLDGVNFLAACRKIDGSIEGSDAVAVASKCQCRLDRLQAIGFSQTYLDAQVAAVEGSDTFPSGLDWEIIATATGDAEIGCRVAAGEKLWQPNSIQHGEKGQVERLNFGGFVDACMREEWIISQRKIRSPDRALGLCGCLARELPTYGVDQDRMDLLTRYYTGDISETDVNATDDELLHSHDDASEACLRQFPQ